MSPYITTYNVKPPTTETTSSATAPAVQTATAAELANAIFLRGPIYTHGAGGLVATVEPDQAKQQE
jgi:hypothetical protein